MKAIIQIDVPDHQIGQEVSIYFKDTMMIKSIVQEPSGDLISRQAVLDIIDFEDKWLLDAKGHNADTEIAFSGMKSRIAELSSVNPQEPCDDAISRQIISDYVQSHIQEINTGYGDLNKHTNEILRMIVDYIESMPSVKPQEPKTQHWINITDKELHDFRTCAKLCFECSECRSQYTYKSNYCPNCGADMRGDTE